MKKLALALVCLVSVAFFASCDPQVENPEPKISIIAEEGYLVGGEVVEMDVVYPFGFIVSSNPETQKELAKLVIVCGEETICDTVISGTEFVYRGEIYFTPNDDSREIVGSAEINATVTDAAGQTNTATIKVDINQETALETGTFEWRRDNGADGTGLEEYGLKWEKNVNGKTVAKIEPLEGATLVVFAPEDWTSTTTVAQKAALFTEVVGVNAFQEVSTTASNTYDLVIGTIYNENTYLIHITKCEVYERGWHFVITGEVK